MQHQALQDRVSPMDGEAIRVPLIIRGEIIEEDMILFPGRHGGVSFSTPDVRRYLNRMPLRNPSDLKDYYAISLDEIIDFLVALGSRLAFDTNRHLQEAYALSLGASGLTQPILHNMYRNGLQRMFERDWLEEVVDRNIGRDYLEGWVPTPLKSGIMGEVRAFGARGLHVVPGNAALAAGITVVRCAVTRSDAVIKSPSNDPMTHAAVIRTMIEMDPTHPVTRHFTVGYWKGGDEEVEKTLYHPANIEKIVAWGGMGSIKHIVKYLQPGIDLITLEPKFSSSIVGRETFSDETTMREAAGRLALDVGGVNQEGCANSRVIYTDTGTDLDGIATAERFAQMVLEGIAALPERISTRPKDYDPELAAEMEALVLDDIFFHVVGRAGDAAIIVSQEPEPVEFSRLLGGRTANIVPIDGIEQAIRSVNSYTQTIGVYPEKLRHEIRDRLGLHGAQRVVALGCAISTMMALPQDGMEPLRRMCRWVSGEGGDSAAIRNAVID